MGMACTEKVGGMGMTVFKNIVHVDINRKISVK